MVLKDGVSKRVLRKFGALSHYLHRGCLLPTRARTTATLRASDARQSNKPAETPNGCSSQQHQPSQIVNFSILFLPLPENKIYFLSDERVKSQPQPAAIGIPVRPRSTGFGIWPIQPTPTCATTRRWCTSVFHERRCRHCRNCYGSHQPHVRSMRRDWWARYRMHGSRSRRGRHPSRGEMAWKTSVTPGGRGLPEHIHHADKQRTHHPH